jgi:hypothetical protein
MRAVWVGRAKREGAIRHEAGSRPVGVAARITRLALPAHPRPAQLNTVFHRTAPGNDDDEEIAHLEAENTALRAEAHALLQHQAKLEGLVEAARAAAAAAAAGEDILKSMRSKLSSGGGGPAGAKA